MVSGFQWPSFRAPSNGIYSLCLLHSHSIFRTTTTKTNKKTYLREIAGLEERKESQTGIYC